MKTKSDSQNEKLTGMTAWALMSLGIFIYDMFAIRTQKAETMSGALWRLLKYPVKSVPLVGIWGIVTYHLFGSSMARESYKTAIEALHNKSIIGE